MWQRPCNCMCFLFLPVHLLRFCKLRTESDYAHRKTHFILFPGGPGTARGENMMPQTAHEKALFPKQAQSKTSWKVPKLGMYILSQRCFDKLVNFTKPWRTKMIRRPFQMTSGVAQGSFRQPVVCLAGFGPPQKNNGRSILECLEQLKWSEQDNTGLKCCHWSKWHITPMNVLWTQLTTSVITVTRGQFPKTHSTSFWTEIFSDVFRDTVVLLPSPNDQIHQVNQVVSVAFNSVW